MARSLLHLILEVANRADEEIPKPTVDLSDPICAFIYSSGVDS